MKFFKAIMYPLILCALIVLGVAPEANAQKLKYKLADKYYRSFDFHTSSDIYRDILAKKGHDSDTVALRRLAECQWKLGNLSIAESIMEKVVTITVNNPNDLLAMAELLRKQGKYTEALDYYTKFKAVRPGNIMAEQYLSEPSFATNIKRDSSIFSVISLGVNSPASDFAPSFYSSSKVIFSSAKGEGKGGKKQYLWNNQPYLNIYLSEVNLDSTLGPQELMGNKFNTRYHEGAVTYDYRYTTMYFSRNNFLRGSIHKSTSGQLNLGIYSSTEKDGAWGDLKAFAYNNKEYSVAHPTITIDGSRMYFVSDKPGGVGGSDIYYCLRKEGEWGEPMNAGMGVNTAGNEMFPCAVGDSTLYFASDGHVGLGGLDIFYTNALADGLTPHNMGYPVNTRYDDFGLITFPGELAGYFCSNRPSGQGDDDVYLYKMHPPDSAVIAGIVIDADSGLPIPGAKVWAFNLDGEQVQTLSADDGSFHITAQWQEFIELYSSKKDYTDGWMVVKGNPRSAYMEGVVIKMKKYDFVAMGKVLLAENNLPAVGAVVRAIDEHGAVVDSVMVGPDGRYFLPLSKDRKYVIEAALPGFVTLSTDVDTSDPKKKESLYDFKLFKPEKGTIVRLDNIYYDYNKAEIRADAALELNKLVKMLNDFPTMKIELSSHTDARGSDSYNLSLSERRAKSAVEYLKSQGIESKRLVAKGYGETKLLNKCDDGINCTEDEHSYNRRTEFKILDI